MKESDLIFITYHGNAKKNIRKIFKLFDKKIYHDDIFFDLLFD
jgi:hypothetical protein